MENALAALKAFDWGADRNALKPITKAISEAHDNPEASVRERKLLGVLAGETKGPGKEFICRELGLVGSARALPALERLLLDPETADIARFALERIPDDAASAVLRDALEKTTGLQRIGIINSLGQRQDRGSCKALAALLGDAELPLARAAAEALGRIADKDATRALAAGKDSASAPNRACVLDAYLRCRTRS